MNDKVKAAADYILSHLRDGSWPAGSRIPSENELCRTLGLSRTSVRSAIQRYVSTGVLESVRGKGTYVRSGDLRLLGSEYDALGSSKAVSSFEDLLLVHQARRFIEPEIFAYAAENATPELVERLERCFDRMMDSLGNQKDFVEADMQFHRLLADFIQNKYISACYENLLARDDINYLSNDMFGYYDGLHTHKKILDAIKERNPDKIRRQSTEYDREKNELIRDISHKLALDFSEEQP